MDNEPKNPLEMSALRKFADSDAGRTIIELFTASDPEKTYAAISKASSGNLEEAKKIIESMLSSPGIKAALAELGAENG